MLEVRQTEAFARWLGQLADPPTRARIVLRIERLRRGNPGDARSVGGGVSELKLAFGPGWRIYYAMRRRTVIVLLIGGDKSSQEEDIRAARRLAAGLEE